MDIPHEILPSGLTDSQFVYGNNHEEFHRLQADYIDRFQPRTPEERFEVDTLIRCEWTLRRMFQVEAHLWEYYTLRAGRTEGVSLGEAFAMDSPIFMRRLVQLERSYQKALAQLERLACLRTTSPGVLPPDQNEDDTLSGFGSLLLP